MRFLLAIDCDNAAFGDPDDEGIHDPTPEVRRILKRLVVGNNRPEFGVTGRRVLDSNGNTCGHWEFVDE